MARNTAPKPRARPENRKRRKPSLGTVAKSHTAGGRAGTPAGNAGVERGRAAATDGVNTFTATYTQAPTDRHNPAHKQGGPFQFGFTMTCTGDQQCPTVHIKNVSRNSLAHAAGIKPNCRIVAINGERVPMAIDPVTAAHPVAWVQQQLSLQGCNKMTVIDRPAAASASVNVSARDSANRPHGRHANGARLKRKRDVTGGRAQCPDRTSNGPDATAI